MRRRVADLETLDAGRKGQDALQESEEKFRLLFQKSVDPILLLDGDIFIECNEAAVRLMGCSGKAQLIGLHPLDFSPERQPDGRLSSEKAQELIDAALRKGVIRFEWVHRTFNGEDLWVDVSLTTIPVPGKRIMYTVWRDIHRAQTCGRGARRPPTNSSQTSSSSCRMPPSSSTLRKG